MAIVAGIQLGSLAEACLGSGLDRHVAVSWLVS